MLAEFDADGVLVQIAADVAAFDLGDVHPAAVIAGRQADPVHLVAGAFVVDERVGAEFADRDEPGPLHVVALAVLGAPVGGDERRERQPGERVAGQEALGGEVAVGVEVALRDVVDLAAQQVQGGAGFDDAGAGAAFGRLGGADLLEHLVGGVEFGERFPVQGAPAVGGLIELGGGDDRRCR